MIDMQKIGEHMEVVGSDGAHVGTVDSKDTTRLKLTKTDPDAGGQHRYISYDLIESISDQQVRLSVPAAEARRMGETRGPEPI